MVVLSYEFEFFSWLHGQLTFAVMLVLHLAFRVPVSVGTETAKFISIIQRMQPDQQITVCMYTVVNHTVITVCSYILRCDFCTIFNSVSTLL